MTTPIDSQFTNIRYFGPLDPYNHAVDNRPLEDLKDNQDILSKAIDSTIHSSKAATMAAGFVARGLSTDNMYVGQLVFAPLSFSVTIDHGYLVQSLPAEIGDIKTYPHVGLQQTNYILPTFTKPVLAGTKTLYMVQAQWIPASSAISFYDGTNSNEANTFAVGRVQYQVKSNASIPVADPDTYPLPDAGWVDILHVKVLESDTQVDEDSITYNRFMNDGSMGSRPYDVWSHDTVAPTTSLTGITVNAYFALFFIGGAYQDPSNYTVVSPTEVTWNEPIPVDEHIDAVVIQGIGSGVGGGGSGTFAYVVESFIAGPGPQQTFGPAVSVDVDYAFIFVNGTFQPDATVNSGLQTITLPDPVPEGSYVDLVMTAGGTILPGGGIPGQVTTKTSSSVDWEYPVSIATVVSESSGTFTVTPGFDETTQLYDGKPIVIKGLDAISTSTNTSINVVIQLGTLSLNLYRPGGVPLRLADMFEGMTVVYTTLPTNRLVLLSPAANDRLIGGTVSGTPDSITLTPSEKFVGLYNGQQFTFTVPGAGDNTSVSPLLQINYNDVIVGSAIKVIKRAGGVNLQLGDIKAGTTATVQYDSTLDLMVLLNPAASGASVNIPGAKRQTVLVGPRAYSANEYLRYRPNLGVANDSGYTVRLAKPQMIRPCTNVGVDASSSSSYFKIFTNVSSIGIAPGSNYVQSIPNYCYASFSAGFGGDGPVEFVEQLSDSAVFDKSTIAANLFNSTPGFVASQIVSISQNVADYIDITFNTTHPYYPGMWIRIDKCPAAGLNGIHCVTSRISNTIVRIYKPNIVGYSIGSPADVTIDSVVFLYAERNPTTGVVTYGYTPLRPMYINSRISDRVGSHVYSGLGYVPSTGISKLRNYFLNLNSTNYGQCVFDIDEMKMSVGGIPVLFDYVWDYTQRVFLGEVYLPHSSITMTDLHMTTYAYNGEVSFEITTPQFSAIYPMPNSNYFFLYHGMGTLLYDTDFYISLGATEGAVYGTYSSVYEGFQQKVIKHHLPQAGSWNGEINSGFVAYDRNISHMKLSMRELTATANNLTYIDNDGELKNKGFTDVDMTITGHLKRSF